MIELLVGLGCLSSFLLGFIGGGAYMFYAFARMALRAEKRNEARKVREESRPV